MAATPTPKGNLLLAALPEFEYSRLLPLLKPVDLPSGRVLYESGAPMADVYFPTSGIVSLLLLMQNGASAEICVIGNDGLVGMALLMGGDTASSRAVVQCAGSAYRLPGTALRQEFERDSPLRPLLLRYTQALFTQMAQTAVCNRHHSLEQQLCRWLLLCLDRLPSNKLTMTQELIANMLGVRRQGVTAAARVLQEAGIMHYRHGYITVDDRPALEARVCECYSVVRRECDRLLPPLRY